MLRLLEDPLGEDAREQPTREAVAALWNRAKLQPVPDYERTALRRLVLPRG